MILARSKWYWERYGEPNASIEPANSLSLFSGSYSYHFALGMASSSRRFMSKTLGDAVASLRMHSPLPAASRSAAKCDLAQLEKLSQLDAWLLCITCRLRSGSYSSSTLAWAHASVAPRFIGCSGLPSILIGRPS